jgi:uncharacterized phage protein gp47/JayE
MANLNTQSLASLVSNFSTAVQGSAAQLVDFTIGSVLRAIDEAIAYVALWLQALILQFVALTRAATSTGADLDSWFADFGFARLAAISASGLVTFARFTPTAQAVIPVGAVVQTADGTQQFTVVLDTTNSAYSASLGGYVLAAGVASVSVTVSAVNPGSVGNVVLGAISQLGQAISGVDTVTNAAAFTNGVDAETDAAARARFVLYLASLSEGTKVAIGNAIASLQLGLSYTLTENYTYGGVYQPGFFYVVVDDGTGSPPSTLLSTVYNAIDLVRPFTSTFAVFAPVVINAAVVMTITTATGYTHSAIAAIVQTALQKYINSLPLGAPLNYTKLESVAYGASTAVTNVSAVTLNGGTADLTTTNQQIIKYSTVTVN